MAKKTWSILEKYNKRLGNVNAKKKSKRVVDDDEESMGETDFNAIKKDRSKNGKNKKIKFDDDEEEDE